MIGVGVTSRRVKGRTRPARVSHLSPPLSPPLSRIIDGKILQLPAFSTDGDFAFQLVDVLSPIIWGMMVACAYLRFLCLDATITSTR